VLARGRVYTGEDAKAAGLVDVLGGFEAALREVVAMLPAELRDVVEPHLVRAPRRPLPILEPPLEGEAGRRAASAILSALLPTPERVLVELAATGDRVLALWMGGDAAS
jgi:protease-4